MLLYADDIVCLTGNEINLQEMINVIKEWCEKWRLELNTDKTKVVHFRKLRRKASKFLFKYRDETLEIVEIINI